MALPAEPKTTLTVGMVEGGAGVNSIPSSARAKVDIRSGSESAIRRVVARMEAEVRRAMRRENQSALDTLSNLRIREIGYRPAAAYRAENRMAACMRSVDQYLGIRSRMDCASTDANLPLALGKAAAAIGAGGRGGGAHSAAEWYSPDGRALGLERILLAVALMMSQDGF
jgi:acetylornithine deacetylase/succinyl-diaminopimelate desuccinylase-like protein